MQREPGSWEKHSERLEVQYELHVLPSYHPSSSCPSHTLGATLHLVPACHLPLPTEDLGGVHCPVCGLELVVDHLE